MLKKAKTEEDKELFEWVGEDYNPELFDLEDTNIALNPKKYKNPKLKFLQGGGDKT